MLDCERLRASLSLAACQDNFRGEKCLACIGCPTGAEIAGAAQDATPGRATFRIRARSTSRSLSGCVAQRCLRCQQPATRLIGHSICVGCYNRQRELAAGRNAKGRYPTRTASRVRPFCALIEAPRATIERLMAGCASLYAIQQYGTGTLWVQGFSSGPDEVERFIDKFLPGATMIDFEAQPAVPEAA